MAVPVYFVMSKSQLVIALRIIWLLIIIHGEILVFVNNCLARKDKDEYIMAIVADPQLTDRYSYKMIPGVRLSIVELLCDVYMRRSFKNIKGSNPDSVLILGDMLDGGREWTDSE